MTRPPSDHQLEDRTYLSSYNLVTEPKHPDEMYEFLLSEVKHIDWDCPDEDRYGRECQSHMRSIARWRNAQNYRREKQEAAAWCPSCGTEDIGRYDVMLKTRFCVDCIDDRWLERMGNYYRTEEVTYLPNRAGHLFKQKASCPAGISVTLSWDAPPGPCAHAPSHREQLVAIHNLLAQARRDNEHMETWPDR